MKKGLRAILDKRYLDGVKGPYDVINRHGYPCFPDTMEPIHRIFTELLLGRKLKKNEDVHHIDEDKTNYHRDNLVVMDHNDHWILHELMWKYGLRITVSKRTIA